MNPVLAKKIPLLLLCLLLVTTVVLAIGIRNLHAARVEERRTSLSNVVDIGLSTLKYFGAQAYAGKLSKDDAQAQAREVIRSLRYGPTGYLTIISLKGDVLMHPFQPQLNGKNMLGFQDARGTFLYRDIVAAAGTPAAGGFVEYVWQRPGDSEASPKISRVGTFQEWGWVLVAGEYTDDMELDLGSLFGR